MNDFASFERLVAKRGLNYVLELINSMANDNLVKPALTSYAHRYKKYQFFALTRL